MRRSPSSNEVHHGDEDQEQTRALLGKRASPRFFIIDRHCDVLFCSPDLVDSQALEASKRVLENLLAHARTIADTVFECLDDDVMLRVVPLAGERTGYFAVFFEVVSTGNVLASAINRYELTKREAEVLEALLNGLSTAEIAQSLFISEGTVGDHIKNLLRKTKTNRRSEMLARVLYIEDRAEIRRIRKAESRPTTPV